MGRLLLRVLLVLLPVTQAPPLPALEASAPLTLEAPATVQAEPSVVIDCAPPPVNELGLLAACVIRPASS